MIYFVKREKSSSNISGDNESDESDSSQLISIYISVQFDTRSNNWPVPLLSPERVPKQALNQRIRVTKFLNFNCIQVMAKKRIRNVQKQRRENSFTLYIQLTLFCEENKIPPHVQVYEKTLSLTIIACFTQTSCIWINWVSRRKKGGSDDREGGKFRSFQTIGYLCLDTPHGCL